MPDGSDRPRGAHDWTLPRRRRLAVDRARDRPRRGRPEGHVHRQQGGHPRPARHARARGAVRQARGLHRRERQAHHGGRARQRRRERRLHEQRGDERREGLGHARALDGALRQGRQRGRRAAPPRPPEEPGHPTHWHARGYGLFAANPLGAKVFSEGKEQLELRDREGRERHLPTTVLLVLPGPFSKEKAEKAFAEFTARYSAPARRPRRLRQHHRHARPRRARGRPRGRRVLRPRPARRRRRWPPATAVAPSRATRRSSTRRSTS